MKIDVSCHILPEKFYKKLLQKAPPKFYMAKRWKSVPSLTDLGKRLEIMDNFEDYAQLLTLSSPPLEEVVGSQDSAELARIANDEIAELVSKYPDRFPAAVATLPMNNTDAAHTELDRAIKELGMKGIIIYTSINGKPLDDPEFSFVFEKMAGYDLPIWLHPVRSSKFSDYDSEDRSKYDTWIIFGWPYDTAAAMTRIIFNGTFDKYPNLKIITHHLGGIVPFLSERIKGAYEEFGTRTDEEDNSLLNKLQRPPFEYFKMFYADTALHGSIPAMECGFAFFGAERVLFGTDMPFDRTQGLMKIRRTIDGIEGMRVSAEDKKKMFETNAAKLLNMKA